MPLGPFGGHTDCKLTARSALWISWPDSATSRVPEALNGHHTSNVAYSGRVGGGGGEERERERERERDNETEIETETER